MNEKQIQEIVARAEDEYEWLKDKAHDQQKEIERLNDIIEQIIEYIEYSLKNKDSDERMILQMVLAKLKVELKEGK